jgi:uncharacterized protein
MQIIISPAKKQSFPETSELVSSPVFSKKTNQLIKVLKDHSIEEIQKLMSLSFDLANLNADRYANFNSKGTVASPAAISFSGEVYRGLNAKDFSKEEQEYAQNHLNILSGLYGILRPFDPIKAHRLEMGTRLKTDNGTNLYQFWEKDINKELIKRLKQDENPVLINLASNEYNKAAILKEIPFDIITPNFKDLKNGAYKAIMVYAKQARGAMARYIIENKISNPNDLLKYNVDGYEFNPELSKGNDWIFTRS